MRTFVSSANRKGNESLLKIVGTSLIYTKNRKGPRIDPCGSPVDTLPHSE
jgi:hypothetical protein